ncbi:MJ0042-type zinc finger domain-containing protein [Chloroflexota bacterium]
MVIGNTEVEVTCPECKNKFPIKIKHMVNGNKVKCTHCNSNITLKVEGDDLSRPDRELDKLKKQIKDININFKI